MAFNYNTAERLFVTGKVKYCNTVVPNKWNKWSCIIYLDKDSYELILKLKEEKGIKNKLQKDEDGYYMAFSRPVSMQTKQGKVIPFNPPIILDTDGTSQLSNVLLGPQSDVEIKLEMYGYTPPGASTKEYAIRWEALRVITLVQSVTQDFPKREQQQVAGLGGKPISKW
jgi:hypothetical protein